MCKSVSEASLDQFKQFWLLIEMKNIEVNITIYKLNIKHTCPERKQSL